MDQSKSKPINKTEITIVDKSRVYVIEYGDNEEWGRRDCTHTDHDIRGFVISDQYPTLVVPFKVIQNKPYYLLYVLYQTGDSFGYDTGNIEFVGMYKDQDLAIKNQNLIQEHYDKHKENYGIGYDDKFSITLFNTKTKTYKIAVPWTGYFERLESIEIQAVFLKREEEHWI